MTTTHTSPPLTPAVFHILLALSGGERHGYAIMKQVEADSQGKVNMGAGTLYGSLKRMLDAGLVRESDRRIDRTIDVTVDDQRRIYYAITGLGVETLAAEIARYNRIVAPSRTNASSSQKPPRMAHNRKPAHTLYRNLLALYPRAFRDQLGDSMQQTFADLYDDRRRGSKRGLFTFLLWTFVDTAVGVVRGHAFRLRQGIHMKPITNTIGAAALISILLVLPFAILEFAFSRGNMLNNPPLALFGLLWLLSLAFMLILTPTVQTLRAGSGVLANSTTLLLVLLRMAFLVLIAILWGSIILDQLPCFFGVPNCD